MNRLARVIPYPCRMGAPSSGGSAPDHRESQARGDRWDRDRIDVLGIGVTAMDLTSTADAIEAAIEEGKRGYIVIGGVHAIVEAQDNPHLRRCMNEAQLCTADGMPLVWAGRLEGNSEINRVYGPDLMLRLIGNGMAKGWTHYLYGGAPGVVAKLQQRLEQLYPGVSVVGRKCPPFRDLSQQEEEDLIKELKQLQPTFVWFGLTNPKQIILMNRLQGRVSAQVMIGVGAAFDLNAGLLRQAPPAVQDAGLEWLFRLAMEPTRLWRRYATTNPHFLAQFLWTRLRSSWTCRS